MCYFFVLLGLFFGWYAELSCYFLEDLWVVDVVVGPFYFGVGPVGELELCVGGDFDLGFVYDEVVESDA